VRQAAIDFMHRSLLRPALAGLRRPRAAYDAKGNRRSDHVSATNQVARELLDDDDMLVDKVIVTKDRD
jgi:hypothetical protein